VVGRDPLQAADRHRLFVHASAAAGRLAGPVANAAKDAREDVAFPVHHVGVVETALGDQANILRDVGMRRATPLAVHDLVEVIRIGSVCALHGAVSSPYTPLSGELGARITVLNPGRIK
jgi:hypothetical protein